MAIVSDADVLSWMGMVSDDGYVLDIRDAVEQWVERVACRRSFESTVYCKERYDGRGDQWLNLRNYPVTALDRVSIGTLNVINITSSVLVGSATVSVLGTGLRLVLGATTNVSIVWSTYTTLSSVVSAVNSLGGGWSAALVNSAYGSLPSRDLLQVYGRSVASGAQCYLEVPDLSDDSVIMYAEHGQLYRPGGFARGHQNVIVDYTAGYSAADMPEDIQLAVKVLVKYLHQRRQEESLGVAGYSVNGISATFETLEATPQPARSILRAYRRGGYLA